MTADFYDLARYSDEKYFITETIFYADSLKLFQYLLNGKRLMLAWHEVVQKNSTEALMYLNSEPDLKQSYINSGMDNYYSVVGNIYYYGGRSDSAIRYFKLAEPSILKKHDKADWQVLYEQLGAAYTLSGDITQSINYYLKSFALSVQLNNKTGISEISQKLGILCQQQKNYQQALKFTQIHVNYEDTLKSLSRERDLALLGVVRENKNHEQELFKKTKKENIRKNIQYTTISIAIVIAFIMMLLMGSFSVSKSTLRFMGYLFFISLFEFITLIIDNLFLSNAVHNQPLWIWIIKIGLVVLLVPFQHFLEHNITELLESRKLIEARSRFSPKAIWQKLKKTSPATEATGDDSSIL